MSQDSRTRPLGVFLMLLSAVSACFGQLFWKLAVEGSMFYLIIGFLLYFAGALFMIVAYKYGKLSVLQPILSLNYVLSILLGVYVLDEQMSLYKIMGILIIVLGVFLIVRSD